MVLLAVVSAFVHYVEPMRLLLATIFGVLSLPVSLFPTAVALILLGEHHPQPTLTDFTILVLINTAFWILLIPDRIVT
jgi:hypothetical protein